MLHLRGRMIVIRIRVNKSAEMAEMIGFRIERCAIKLSYSFSLSLLSDAVNRWLPLKVVSCWLFEKTIMM